MEAHALETAFCDLNDCASPPRLSGAQFFLRKLHSWKREPLSYYDLLSSGPLRLAEAAWSNKPSQSSFIFMACTQHMPLTLATLAQ